MKLLLIILVVLCPITVALAADARAPAVVTRSASALGLDAITVNGSVHPHGLHTRYYFEYGPTTAYGARTEPVALPPRLAAHYHESWDEGTGGWASWGAKGMEHHREGGAVGGFVRYAEPSRDDPNHVDGIGTVHLVKYVYPGPWAKIAKLPGLDLAAGDADLRDARVSLHVRGNNWVPNGSELVWWTQSQSNIEVFNGAGWRHANWAYTGFNLTGALLTGKWEKIDYRLRNDTDDWTYAGNNHAQQNPERYSYWSINDALGHENADFFHMLVFVDPKNPPRGSIDFDEFHLTYRNYSLLFPSNGGKLLRAPRSPDDPATLTDGWRHGPGHVWRSAASPDGPLEFVYAFKDPVTVRSVQLHQNPDWPAKDVEVLVSSDEKAYQSLCTVELPEKGVPNANFGFVLKTGLSSRASYLKVRLTSGYKKQHWGLGEIEIFGNGATMLPEDEINNVNLDLKGLKQGMTYHYRLVAQNAAGTTHGEDRSYTLPAEAKPLVQTGSATRINSTGATLQGRLNPLGHDTRFYFEYGLAARYGKRTSEIYGGHMITPRSAFATLDGLKPATTYHYRLVATNEKGTTTGPDAVFVTKD
jgi:hypothetical protein